MTAPSDIELFLHFGEDIPTLTHQHGVKPGHANGKSYMYKTTDLKNLERLYRSLLSGYAPETPWNCPIELTTIWYFRRPDGNNDVFKTTKPDTDNMLKTLKDCLTKTKFWKDDSLVASEHTVKVYANPGERIGIQITIHSLEEPTHE
jgi:Holliday junction resolvase RusA-like endonuclease